MVMSSHFLLKFLHSPLTDLQPPSRQTVRRPEGDGGGDGGWGGLKWERRRWSGGWRRRISEKTFYGVFRCWGSGSCISFFRVVWRGTLASLGKQASCGCAKPRCGTRTIIIFSRPSIAVNKGWFRAAPESKHSGVVQGRPENLQPTDSSKPAAQPPNIAAGKRTCAADSAAECRLCL